MNSIFYPIEWFADTLTYEWIGIARETPLGEAVAFFFYDVPKILLLLTAIIFAVGIVRSFFPPERTREYLADTRLYVGNVLAAGLGVLTPFCSCSAVPMFIGFVEAGIPLGVTFSFLIASPMVNELALGLLIPTFGWRVAGAYLVAGLLVAIFSGIVIGKLGLESEIEEYVFSIRMGEVHIEDPTWKQRFAAAWRGTWDILSKVWYWVVVAIAIGAFMHGYLPSDLIARYAGEGNPFAVFVAVLVGIPLYGNAASAVPIASVLVAKGVQVGTVLAFMMAVTALSVPELVILRKVMKPKLLAIFVGICGVTIMLVGYAFNLFL